MSLLDADIHSAHPSVIIDADAMFSEDISYFGYPSFVVRHFPGQAHLEVILHLFLCDYWLTVWRDSGRIHCM